MIEEEVISQKKLDKLAKVLCKEFGISSQKAYEIIYDEWDLIERLFDAHKKVKAVKEHFLKHIKAQAKVV
jgi:hypothetical protein